MLNDIQFTFDFSHSDEETGTTKQVKSDTNNHFFLKLFCFITKITGFRLTIKKMIIVFIC